jgi:hypothetical protein
MHVELVRASVVPFKTISRETGQERLYSRQA